MKTSVIGYPRIGALRELKFACEKYFAGNLSEGELQGVAKELRLSNLKTQEASGLDFIPSNDFSFYDGMLDTAFLLGAEPKRCKEAGLKGLDAYFAAARGYQGERGDVKALAMKKWFNTNYHYIVPELCDDTRLRLAGRKPFDLFEEALSAGVKTKPAIIGAYTFLKLAHFTGKKRAADFAEEAAAAYVELLRGLFARGAEWVQIDEPCLVLDMDGEDRALFVSLYEKILAAKGGLKVLLQTYFGDVRDCYEELCSLPFDGLGLDFIEGKKSFELVRRGFPADKTLFAGLVNGKNIWKNNYAETVRAVERLRERCKEVVLSASCSLLHVPYTLKNEKTLPETVKKRFSYAEEKLEELADLKNILGSAEPYSRCEYLQNAELFAAPRGGVNEKVREKTAALSEKDFIRQPAFAEREKIQKERLCLPVLPATTIGSFPQTAEVRKKRAAFKKGEISEAEYERFIEDKIAECIALQEEIGLDVLVHGEFERGDMVEYFGERLEGFLFTEKAWVQSYGTRCVKPPVVWGDISRPKPMTLQWSVYAQSLTEKPVKGMLTGPVTILNWSFPREDVPLKESAYQLALAIREEVLDLEANGISVIQVDEAALREKLPLRKEDRRADYLDWAIPAFRLVHSGVRAQTQIHTHMCYSEFTDIISDIDDMDADVITFEASRSDLAILDALKANDFRTECGPGVYDIHSPRVPSAEEIKAAVKKMLEKLPLDKLWINPDCGLKTRGLEETAPALKNMVRAAEELRNENIGAVQK